MFCVKRLLHDERVMVNDYTEFKIISYLEVLSVTLVLIHYFKYIYWSNLQFKLIMNTDRIYPTDQSKILWITLIFFQRFHRVDIFFNTHIFKTHFQFSRSLLIHNIYLQLYSYTHSSSHIHFFSTIPFNYLICRRV